MVENKEVEACKEQHQLVALIRKCFKDEDIYTDNEQLENYLGLQKYFPFDLFDWEKFLLALHLCTYKKDKGVPRFPDLFLLSGRGTGKDGFIAFVSKCLISHYNGIKHYDIDICANNEDQAMRPFEDIYNVLEDPQNIKKLKRFFYWNKEEIISLKTKSKIKFRTNSPKGKDSLRSGAVIFNEIHQYENYANINVFTTGLGKKKHPRRSFLTTDGDVRDGPLDHKKDQAKEILDGKMPDNGMLPFICRLDNKKEVHNKKKWPKANPSLPYMPDLMEEMEKEYKDWKVNPSQFSAFMTKRMNIPDGDKEIEVTSWENIKATNIEIPDLTGWNCVAGLDYSMITDFASVNLHFKNGDLRFDINHSWLCLQSGDLPRIKAPWREWADQGLITLVDDVEIHPELLTNWIQEKGALYNIMKISLDNFRYALMANALEKIGFSAKEQKNVKLVQPSDIMKIVPVIDSGFANKNFVWGDNPTLRWAANNTKKIKSSKKQGSDTGNYYYGKIEAKSRKTDPFMAFVASMTIEAELPDNSLDVPDVDVYTY
jgi:phage terminase large subunit-like protein